MGADKERLRYASILSVLIVCALALAAHLVYVYLSDPQRFPVNTVRISATYRHISRQQLEKVLDAYANASFFSLPVSRLLADLKALEWIDEAQIERVWPDILKISLVEKIPAAIWNNGMITERGEIFNEGAELADSSLPRLKGAANQAHEVLQVYQKMSKILAKYGLWVASLERRGNDAWVLTLADGVQLRLGKTEPLKKIERFCKAYPGVFREKTDQLVSVDLRYPRGMAVQWKK